MSAHEHQHHEDHGSVKSYIIGFVLSIILSIIPIMIVVKHMLSPVATIASILVMAVLQFLIQLFFFMHIREGERPRYNVMALILGMVFVVTIVGGSIWVMSFNSQVQ
ncbi:cytochrome o ubiquinol oxidase operon protein cyoD [Aneurinibacillus soli]|uniref:Cytochrome bo(3) ubiquinol oxidase subunit 4 n=1 Tax=Aneurinibacillus soli TaxID=1500254 RepID=A0A0U5B5V8_9BACL|nr:cytochrome o ubiquinol oxidase subunit IV [Aneurinibacillus soli]PYE61217.1 cytochrome o ubiquinol oxidase operon protein cyoD [Aneurinibacillus soli]BAU26348.1 Cytochrome bo(3) ubiquinol oxidase subunit 4 [Aneurinibacillus soli]